MVNSQRHKRRGWKFLTCKVHSTQWKHTILIGDFLEKQPFPFYHLCFSSKEGNSAAHLPESLCALGVCRRFQYLENYSEHVLLSGEAWFFMKTHSSQKHGKPAHNEGGWSSPDFKLTNKTKQEAYLQSIFHSVNAHQPQKGFALESHLCLFST